MHQKDSDRRRALSVLDDADHVIIESLMADGRASNRVLAARTGLSEATIGARIRNLQQHALLGVSTIFDWEAAGFVWDLTVWISVEGRPVQEVAEALAKHDAVHWAMLTYGASDIVLRARFVDQLSVTDFVAEQLRREAGVARCVIDVNFETIKYAVHFARLPIARDPIEFPAPKIEISDLDRHIIDALTVDGRQSNRSIGRALGVSDGTVRSHLGRLIDANVLRICGQTDPYLTGQVGAWAFVSIDVGNIDLRQLADSLAAMSSVLTLSMTSGPEPLMAFIVAAHRGQLIDVVEHIREQKGVRRTQTAEVARTVKLDYRWARLV